MTQKFNPYKTFAHDGKALSQYKEVPLWECPKCGGKVDTRMELVRDHKCPEEEKTQTAKQADILYKVSIKRNGITIYHVQGTNSVYYVTISNHGTISSCVDEHDNTCKGFLYNRTCKHIQAVERKIAESQPLSTDQKGYLHSASGKAFTLLK